MSINEEQQNSSGQSAKTNVADKVVKAVVIAYNHRRAIAMVIGTILTILGYGDIIDGSVA